MAKPAGYLVFDRDHPMLAGGKFHSGSTFSNYADSIFEWETQGVSQPGYMLNGVWDTDKGIEAKNGQDRRYGVINTPPPDYYTTMGALLFVFEHNGARIDGGSINETNSPSSPSRGILYERSNDVQLGCFNVYEFVNTTGTVGVENAVCYRLVTPPAGNNGNMVWRLYTDVAGYRVPGNRNIDSAAAWTGITDNYFLHNPGWMYLVPNITLNMVCYIEGDFTHNEALAWVDDPWQITKEGVIVPPSAGDSPIMLGASF